MSASPGLIALNNYRSGELDVAEKVNCGKFEEESIQKINKSAANIKKPYKTYKRRSFTGQRSKYIQLLNDTSHIMNISTSSAFKQIMKTKPDQYTTQNSKQRQDSSKV